ncbi:hypothetical protein HOO54_02970 [Bacillus sp. WMMC1349]|uniref:hypothetical protein n=1 Tax=Bacillus sp. WMMC1349 TaxID=2736254 RepID=UPI0015516503|nr:hypothetical protein [Bacillus sp. WMMC1349]NPC91242.1 hypothetical protein [Bacillus sp. WMMC1349]
MIKENKQKINSEGEEVKRKKYIDYYINPPQKEGATTLENCGQNTEKGLLDNPKNYEVRECQLRGGAIASIRNRSICT